MATNRELEVYEQTRKQLEKWRELDAELSRISHEYHKLSIGQTNLPPGLCQTSMEKLRQDHQFVLDEVEQKGLDSLL